MDAFQFPKLPIFTGGVSEVRVAFRTQDGRWFELGLWENQLRGTVGGMHPVSTSGAQHDAEPIPTTAAIAGRLDASATALPSLIEQWGEHLLKQNRAPTTAATYVCVLHSIVRDAGWSKPSDLTTEAISEHFEAQRSAGVWKAQTCNRNLSPVKSFCRWLRKRRLLEGDPTTDIELMHADEHTLGSRAATTEEARAMLLDAAASDSRSKHPGQAAALILLLSFLAGFRDDEHRKLRWEHLQLDEPIPFMIWTKDINKSKRHEFRVLHPLLAELLRRHRDRMREFAATCGGVKSRRVKGGRMLIRPFDPSVPKAFVFPTTATKTAFVARRDKMKIASVDKRGRKFTSHSARKWFATKLGEAGCNEHEVDFYLRHSGETALRYTDPSDEKQAEVLGRLPEIWPIVEKWGPADKSAIGNLTNRAHVAEHGVPRRGLPNPNENLSEPGIGIGASLDVEIEDPCTPVLGSDKFPRGGAAAAFSADQDKSPFSELLKATSGIRKNGDLIPLISLLESLAALLRQAEKANGTGETGGRVG